MRALRRFLLLMILLALVAGAWLWRDLQAQLSAPLALSASTPIEVPSGATLAGTLEDLRARGVLGDPRLPLYLRLHARLSGETRGIKAGEYELLPGMSARDMFELLVSGKTMLHELRVVEGWTFLQMMDLLRAHRALRQTLPQDPVAVMAAIGHAGVHPEGRFFPDTYRFPRNTSDAEFLRRAYEAMTRALEQEWSRRAEGLPYRSPDEALVMASIIEKETGVPAERAEIAGVFLRRLQIGMRLQTDPTVIYGLAGRFDGNLRRADLTADTPYNTYTRAGLPPTPICLPGRAAIQAALRPAAGNALYFVSRGDGTHVFSETLEQHEAAVRRFQLGQR